MCLMMSRGMRVLVTHRLPVLFLWSLTALILPLTTCANHCFCGTVDLGKDLTKDQLAVISALVKGGKKNEEISVITGLPLRSIQQ